MHEADLVLRGQRVVIGREVRAASVHVAGGTIVGVTELDDVAARCPVIEVGDDVLMPGLVDTHVHVNEPGRTAWEGFVTATRAAAAGGVTTIVDMPLNSVPPTTTVAGLEVKRAAAEGRVFVDTGFWGGAVPGNAHELSALHDAGVFGFKCFLAPSGVDEFGCLDNLRLREVMVRLAALDALLIVHAESPGPIAEATASLGQADPRAYRTWMASRPTQAEVTAVEEVIDAARGLGARVHIVHVSSAEAAGLVARARAEQVRVSAETCPHYLALAAEDIADGATEAKCAPPIREAGNRDLLWDALASRELTVIVSDHSPCPPQDKRLPQAGGDGDFLRAWGGIASLQVGLAVTWTHARVRGHSVADVAAWMADAPARLVGLDRKGAIAPGADADLVQWTPEATFVVDPQRLEHRHPVTPYAGQRLSGVVRRTWLRGRQVFASGGMLGEPSGRLLVRPGATGNAAAVARAKEPRRTA